MNSPFTILLACKRLAVKDSPIGWQILNHAHKYLYLTEQVISLSREEYHAVCGNVEHSDTLFWNDRRSE